MTLTPRDILLFLVVLGLILITGFYQSWNVALNIVNMGLISAIMALGVNMQWGYAGLFNIGVMGFVALGGLGAVLVSMPPVNEAWAAGGIRIILALLVGAATIVGAIKLWNRMAKGRARALIVAATVVIGFFIYRYLFDPAVAAIEAVNPATTGYSGGLGLPIIIGWPVGAALAAGAAWVVGKTALGLRSDYLAIATLGIAEIIIAVLKNEDWLSRGVKNVIGLPRPVPYEIDLQNSESFVERMTNWGFDPVTASSITVKLAYASLFVIVLLLLIWLTQTALNSPWGRMMRAIRDNEVAAEAMGKNVTARHLQIFVLGSAVCGLAGAMMTTLDGQLTPASYQPLRFTFLVWVMVIVGGSGNNWGAVLGGFLIWYLWVMVEPMGLWLIQTATAGLADGSALKEHLLESAAHMRLFTMGPDLVARAEVQPARAHPGTVIVTFIPAAGASSRMRGKDKLLEEIDGVAILRRTAIEALKADLGPVTIGIRPKDKARRKALRNLPVTIIEVENAEEGMAATLRAGAAHALSEIMAYQEDDYEYSGMCVLLPDMPGVWSEYLKDMDVHFQSSGGQPVRAVAPDGTPGHPVLFPDYLLREFEELRGDQGAASLLGDEAIQKITLASDHATRDLDTPEDWAAYRASRQD